MVCIHCQKEVDSTAKYCERCGNRLSHINRVSSYSSPKICSSCLSVINNSDKFCKNCGNQLYPDHFGLPRKNRQFQNASHNIIYGNLMQIISMFSSIKLFISMLTVLFIGIGILFYINFVTPEDAIRIETKISYESDYYEDIYIKNYDKNKNTSYYYNELDKIMESDSQYSDEIIPRLPVIYVDVVSESKNEYVKLAPYLVVKIDSIQPFPETYTATYKMCYACGSADSTDYFIGILSTKEKNIVGAPYYGVKDNVDSFLLQSGEREVFELWLQSEPGFKYQFRVGVTYNYKGRQLTKYDEKVYTIANPKYIYTVNYDYGDTFGPTEKELSPDMEVRRLEYYMKVRKSSSFPLPK